MMQQRHRVPTIFNIYMLDVICCALGCVVLLWQVAHQEATEQTAAAHSTQAKFEQAHREFLAATSDVTQLQNLLAALELKHKNVSQTLALTEKERAEARKLAAMRQEEIDTTRKALSLSEDQLKKLNDELARLLADDKKTRAELTGQLKVSAEQLVRIVLAEKQIATLKKELAQKQTDLDASTRKGKDQVALLNLSEESARKLEKLLALVRDEKKSAQTKLKLTELQLKMRDQELERSRIELKDILASKEKTGKELSVSAKDLLDAKKQLAALTAERDLLEKKLFASARDLTSATGVIGSLQTEKTKLNQRVLDLQSEVEQRFAGVPLTGESIVFLIDVSGSMVMKDAKTEDPDKWPFLCDTLMQLMRSIPTMKRFQVILFSDKTSYLFGSRDYWLKYEGPATAQAARNALRKFEVGGNTNMHDGFEEAFRYRKLGLDTVYLFSDGLPNVGAGLPATIKNATEEQLNFHLGKFVRAKLQNDWNRAEEGKPPVRINAIGFYFESPEVGAFLWAMTREHRGSFVGLR
jgi:hypothetical protein